jgi:hypothetical protein
LLQFFFTFVWPDNQIMSDLISEESAAASSQVSAPSGSTCSLLVPARKYICLKLKNSVAGEKSDEDTADTRHIFILPLDIARGSKTITLMQEGPGADEERSRGKMSVINFGASATGAETSKVLFLACLYLLHTMLPQKQALREFKVPDDCVVPGMLFAGFLDI